MCSIHTAFFFSDGTRSVVVPTVASSRRESVCLPLPPGGRLSSAAVLSLLSLMHIVLARVFLRVWSVHRRALPSCVCLCVTVVAPQFQGGPFGRVWSDERKPFSPQPATAAESCTVRVLRTRDVPSRVPVYTEGCTRSHLRHQPESSL